METIIFVCTGNTCRSPMAEGLFRAHNGEEKTGLTAASAGLYTENGLPASANAVAAAGERGADISAHRSRQLTAEMAENAKYLVCMTGSHYDRLCELFPCLLYTSSYDTNILSCPGGNPMAYCPVCQNIT